MLKTVLTAAIVSVIVGLGFALSTHTPAGGGASQTVKESALELITRTNTLRCGYGLWEPGLAKDPITGKLSGIFYDYLEAIAKHADIKIEWTEEVPWGDYPTALNSGRIDAMCFGAWPKAILAREILFTDPIYFLPVYAYVRVNDVRFDHNLAKANAPDVTLSVMDSELSSQLASSDFPQAKLLSVPQLADSSTLLLNVATGKADMTFTDSWTGAAFMGKNPNQIRVVPIERPLRLFGHTIPVAKGEQSLVSFLNTVTQEIESTGELEAIIRKYETMPGVLLTRKTEYH